uniref:Uncharacterized protein n=1 Tax=Oryza punctata TaxID=4537 RepID=A0A0E0KTL4_ORYPU
MARTRQRRAGRFRRRWCAVIAAGRKRVKRGGTGMCAAEDAKRVKEEERENATAPVATEPPNPAASFPSLREAAASGKLAVSQRSSVRGVSTDGAREQSLPSRRRRRPPRRGRHPPHCPRRGVGMRSSGWEHASISLDTFHRPIAVSAAGIVPPSTAPGSLPPRRGESSHPSSPRPCHRNRHTHRPCSLLPP